jgi:tetraacyldisaccharide 4'-kinase
MIPRTERSDPRASGGLTVVERAAAYGWARRTIYGDGGALSVAFRGLAAPIASGWAMVADRRLRRDASAVHLGVPTISVGNVTIGGGGKTSLVHWLITEGLVSETRVAVLSRGYGRSANDVAVIPPAAPSVDVAAVGDEPALLAKAGAWVGVGSDRSAAARAVLAVADVDLFLLDDGLQHRQVARQLDLIVFTARDLIAPAKCLPSGPLRQRSSWQPPRGAWVVSGVDPRSRTWPPGSIGRALASWWEHIPGTVVQRRDAGTVDLAGWLTGSPVRFDVDDRRVIVIAGVADPVSVARFAEQAGWSPAKVVAFPDHHRFSQREIAALLTKYPDVPFVTTEKDAIRCQAEWFNDRPVGVLRRRLQPSEPELLTELVTDVLVSSPR